MTGEREYTRQEFYEFKVKGCLDGDWTYWFDNLKVIVEDDETRLYGPIADQASLYGIIATLRNLGLTLLAVNQIRPEAGPDS